jgi:hypothetical protein
MKINLQSSERGIALIIVMAVVLVLSVLVGGFATSMRVEMRLAQNANYDTELEWLGHSGVELARYVLSQKCPGQQNVETLNQLWAGGTSGCSNDTSGISLKDVELGGGKFSVSITDAERKWNINWVVHPTNPQGMEIMQRAMSAVGMSDAALSSTITDSIFDWADRDDDHHLSGAENSYYLGLDPPYYCKNGLIDDLSELLLIKGIWDHPEIYWGSNSTNHPISAYQSRGNGLGLHGRPEPSYPIGLVDIFTPISSGKININTASAAVLQLIPGMDESMVGSIIQYRSGPDGASGTDDDVPFLNAGNLAGVPGIPAGVQTASFARYCDVRSNNFEVQVDTEINGYKRQFFALISRGGQRPTDFQVFKFYWK